MAPLQRKDTIKILPKWEFSKEFGKQRTTVYSDTTSRSSASQSIRTIAWNPLGTLIATGASDRTLRIWNPEKPNVKNSTELRGHMGAVENVAFNPTTETELASCAADGVVRFWDVRSKASISEVKVGGEAYTLAWKPDGSEIVVGRRDDTLIPIARSTFTMGEPQKQAVQTNHTMFSWSGKELFLTTGEGQVKIIDYPSFTHLHTLNAHTASCHALDLNAHGTYLAVGGNDAIISIWDTKDFICQRTLSNISGPVKSVSFSFDGCYVVGGTDEGSGLEIAHVETGEYVHEIKTKWAAPHVAWHPSKYVLAYAGDVGGLNIIGAIGGIDGK